MVRNTHNSRKYGSANTSNIRSIPNSASVQATTSHAPNWTLPRFLPISLCNRILARRLIMLLRFIRIIVGIKFSQTVRAEAVSEFCLGAALDITLQGLPNLFLILDFFAMGADG